MFRKQDFKKIDLLGSGKKHTKIYKVIHIQTGKTYALKEIEAKTLEKLNEYKEEAVQLAKIQNHQNVIKFFGYYFSETMYNTFRLGLITEFMDHNKNLENIYRNKKKTNSRWSQDDLVSFTFTLISSCSFLQQRGICHRDIKPANLFVLENGECKLIDFGESKDYFYDPDDEERNTYTVATIRGTPQYLSPALWKAHVIDGNSRYVEHNIYKSDVFSCGLVISQLALMQEVNGFNNKTQQNDGEKIIKEALLEMEKIYSPQIVNIIALMLIFEESNRPSFTEIEQLFIEHENQVLEQDPLNKNKKMNEFIQIYNKKYNTLIKKDEDKKQEISKKSSLEKQDKKNNIFDTSVYRKKNIYWFEFGGNSIGRFSIEKQRWKVKQIDDIFPYHFITLYAYDIDAYYLIGGDIKNNFRVLQKDNLQHVEKQMPGFRNFFSCVYHQGQIFVFGGFDNSTQTQLKTCELFDIKKNQWKTISDLNIARSQSSACVINENEIVIMGGYNKELGTLNSIEKYNIKLNKFIILQNTFLSFPLRRFGSLKIHENKILIFGGQTTQSNESQKVFRIDFKENLVQEMQNLEKGGVIENEGLIDNDDCIHLFLENSNGTSPYSHIKYLYDQSCTQHVTKEEY